MLSRFLLVGLCVALGACAQFTERSTGLDNNTLTDCPAWPRCVNSVARDDEKRTEPYYLQSPVSNSWQNLLAVVSRLERTRIVSSNNHYLHAEVTSPWGWYIDDLELLLNPETGRVDVRSSGRIGYYDFDVNRDRVNALRTTLANENLLKTAAAN